MRAFIIGILAAALFAVAASMILDSGVQQSAQDRHQTPGVRL